MAEQQQQKVKSDDVKIPSREELLNPEVKTQEEGKSDEAQYTAIEQEALKQGWKPKSEWDGDPEQHRSAREYLDRGELLGKIKSQNHQLDDIKRSLAALTEHNKKVYQAGYEKALAELKDLKKEALKEGDVDRVMALDDKIDEAKENIRLVKQQPVSQAGPSATTQQWLAENDWYAKNVSMRRVADGIAIDYAKANPGCSEADLYAYLDKKIREELPEKFKAPARTSAPDPDSGSRRTGSTQGGGKSTTSFEKLMESMGEDQARIARTLVRTGAITKEKYVEDYQAMFGKA